jgi:hypothetical protein
VPVAIKVEYVLVLEWLGESDEPTGAGLYEFLTANELRSELRVCQSSEDVLRALDRAAGEVTTKGIPAVHLETHGTDPWKVEPEDIKLGPSASAGLRWGELGPHLARINVASHFQLLVVSAACWGSGVIAAIGGGEHAAPFSAAVGIRTRVHQGRLRDAMRELYRSLLRGDSFEESIEAAQRELTEGQEMHLEVAVDIAIRMLRTIYYKSKHPNRATLTQTRRRAQARRVWETWFPTHLRERDPAYCFENVIPDRTP